ncbi:MAG: hypothetical protein ACOYD4_04095 [Solirubrobacterales bacterium]
MSTQPPSGKQKFNREAALAVAEALCYEIQTLTYRIAVAGSLRRNRPAVGDIEIVYISREAIEADPADMFSTLNVILADRHIQRMIDSGLLEKRKTETGAFTYGKKNKLVRHVPSGIPVDFFATTEACWFNYLVCRTGPAESNIRIAMEAKHKGYKWNPYGEGFSDLMTDRTFPMHSEEEVFRFVGLPFQPPEKR